MNHNLLVFPTRTLSSAYKRERLTDKRHFHIRKDNGKVHAQQARDKKNATAKKVLKNLLAITNWTPARRKRALSALYELRPSKRQIQARYVAAGESPATARMLSAHYETLPAVQLNKKDFLMLLDVIHGKVQSHKSHIDRVLQS
jgi:hypothetical protein